MANYAGTLLLVSHDRSFLNNVVTSTLVFEGSGRINEYPGGYDDWLEQRQEGLGTKRESISEKQEKKKGTRKLTNKERAELKALPLQIEQLEREQEALHDAMADPSFYQKPKEEIATSTARAEEIPKKLEEAFERWDVLERL